MFKNKEYLNIYLVTGILTLFVIFSAMTLYFIQKDITNNTSAALLKKKAKTKKEQLHFVLFAILINLLKRNTN